MTDMTKPDLLPTMETLNTRLTALEEFVHEEIKPGLDRNTGMTETIHAQSDEMYNAYIVARNGIRVLTAVGNGLVRVSDVVEKRPKSLLMLAIFSGAAWGYFSHGKAPDWLQSVLKLLIA